MDHKSIQRLMQKLKKVNRSVRLLEDTIDIKKTPSGLEKAPLKQQYGDKGAVLLNLTKISAGARQIADITIDETYRLVEQGESDTNDIKMSVDNIIVDLTKMLNDLKDLNVPEDDIKQLEILRSAVRYAVTHIKRNNQSIRELKSKIDQKRKVFESDAYQKALDEFNRQWGIDEIRELEDQFDDIQQERAQEFQQKMAESYGNVQAMEQSSKDIIRALRDVMKRYYDLNDDLLDTALIFMKAYGAKIRLENAGVRYSIPAQKVKELQKILDKDEELRELLQDFIKIKRVSDRVVINGVSFPSLGQYFAEVNSSIQNEIRDLESGKNKATKLEEGMFSDVLRKASTMIMNVIESFTASAKKIFGDSEKKMKKMDDLVEQNFANQNEKLVEIKSKAESLYLEFSKQVKEIEALDLEERQKEVEQSS